MRQSEIGDRKAEIGNRRAASGTPSSERYEPPRYQQLDAWRYADDLAVDVYRLTRRLPADLRPVASQILRAAISAPANIAEGYGRGSNKEFLQFLTVAHASIYEVGYFLHFLNRIEAISKEAHDEATKTCSRASRVVFGLMKSVRSGIGRTGNRRYLGGGTGEPGSNER